MVINDWGRVSLVINDWGHVSPELFEGGVGRWWWVVEAAYGHMPFWGDSSWKVQMWKNGVTIKIGNSL